MRHANIIGIAAVIMSIGASIAQAIPSDNQVFVAGVPIMTVRVGAGGFTPSERATQIQGRLNDILGQGPIYASDVTIQPNGDEYVVMVKGHLLFTADWATARFNDSTPQELAQIWSFRMRDVLPNLTRPA